MPVYLSHSKKGSGGQAGAELTITDSHSNIAIFIQADNVKIVELYLWFKGAETLRLLFGDDNSTVSRSDLLGNVT